MDPLSRLGGTLVVFDRDAYLHGLNEIAPGQQDILGCVLNERLADLDKPTRVPYLRNLPDTATLDGFRKDTTG